MLKDISENICDKITICNTSIHTIQDKNQTWYKANDFGLLLNIRNMRSSCINIDDEFKTSFICMTKGDLQSCNFLNKEGVIHLLQRSRSLKARLAAKEFGVVNHVRFANAEAHFLEQIWSVFQCESMIHQYSVKGKYGVYKIDLYFPQYNLAIECDELAHSRVKNQINDKVREEDIKTSIGCTFIRFSPSKEASFDILCTIRSIFEHIKTYSLEPVKETINQIPKL